MYARVIKLSGNPNQAEKLVDLYRDIAVPSMKAESGFKGGYLLVDRQRGKAISVSLWNSEADLQASEASNRARQARIKEAGGLVAPFEEERFELGYEAQPEPAPFVIPPYD